MVLVVKSLSKTEQSAVVIAKRALPTAAAPLQLGGTNRELDWIR